MSKKDTKSSNGSVNLTEIGTIRDILMGQQINDFESQINKLHERIDQLEKQLQEKADQLQQLSNDKSANLEKVIENRITVVNEKIENKVEKLNTKIETSSTNDKHIIGKMLADFGQKLLNS